MEHFVVIREYPNIQEIIDSVHFSVIVINRQLHLLWSFLCRSITAIAHMVSTCLSFIICLFGRIYEFLFLRKSPSDQHQKSMDKRDRFPLLNLDYVAIREVLNTLDPIDYIHFSKASKSCRSLSSIKASYKVEISFMDFPMLWFRNGSFCSGMKWIKAEQTNRTRTRGDPLDAMKEFYLYARSLMNVEVDYVVFYMDDLGGQCREIVDCLRSICQEFPVFVIHGKNQRHQELQYILDNVKFRDNLHIGAKTIEELPLRIPETIDKLSIKHGSWITLDYVMSLKMSILAFNNAYLTNQEINIFYKNWIDMKSNQNLECFEINIRDRQDFIVVALSDIPYAMGPTIRIPDYAAVEGSFEITRKDGLMASICVYEHGAEFGAVMFTFPFLSRGELVQYFH